MSSEQHACAEQPPWLLAELPAQDFQRLVSILQIFIAFAALVAGAYYFFKRLRIEDKRDRVGRVREHTRLLLDFLNDYDRVLFPAVNGKALRAMPERRRNELLRVFQSIQHFLEANQALLQFSEAELQALQQFHSVVDKSRLMRGSFATESALSLKSNYTLAFKEAQAVCWRKLF